MNMNNEENTLRGIARENDGCCWKVFSTRNITLSIFNYEFQSIVGFGGVIGGSHRTRLLIDDDVGGLELMTKLKLGLESVLPGKFHNSCWTGNLIRVEEIVE